MSPDTEFARLCAGGDWIRNFSSAMRSHRRQRDRGVTPPDPGCEWRLLGLPPDNSIGSPRRADALVRRGVGAAERPRLMGTVASAVSDPGRPGRLRDFSEGTRRSRLAVI